MKKYLLPVYLLSTIIVTFFSYLFVDKNLSYLSFIYSGIPEHYRYIVVLVYIALMLVLFVLYLFILFIADKKHITFSMIKRIILCTAIILTCAYPAMLSYDIFNYILTAKTLYYYHENPYIIPPITFQHDPYLVFTRAINKTALYGPSWLLLSSIPFLLGANIFLLTLFSFKILILTFYIGTLFLLWQMSQKNLFALAFFAFNPLVLIEVLVSGHNDIVMMFFLLFSFYIFKKNIFVALLFFSLSILIKFSTVILIPVYLYMLWNHFHKKPMDWEKIYLYSFFAMLSVFFSSFLREEIYPWYAIWFLVFAALMPKRRILLTGSIILTFGLLLGYVPYMLSGSYTGATPFFRTLLTYTPVGLYALLQIVKKYHG